MYGAVSPLSACDGAESWGWLVSSPHPAHWHRSLVTGPGHSIYPTQPRVRAQHTFAHPWKHAKLTYIYYLSLSLYILTPNNLWYTGRFYVNGEVWRWKTLRLKRSCLDLALKNSKDENIFKDCFYSENHALIIVIWKNHVDVTMLQKSILLIEERCFIYF